MMIGQPYRLCGAERMLQPDRRGIVLDRGDLALDPAVGVEADVFEIGYPGQRITFDAVEGDAGAGLLLHSLPHIGLVAHAQSPHVAPVDSSTSSGTLSSTQCSMMYFASL